MGPLLFLLIWVWPDLFGMPADAQVMLAVTCWIATWWITEAIPIPATSLLPLILLPLLQTMSIAEVSKSYANPMVLLYMGGFMIAVTIEKWNLHKRIALIIIHWIGTNSKKIVLGFMVATAFLSMWISNTATSLMMLPIGIAVVSQLDGTDGKFMKGSPLGKSLMLGIAYAASIGGIATLIGTPTNIILASVVRELYGFEISFSQWMSYGLPVALFLLIICWWYLTSIALPSDEQADFSSGKAEIAKQIKDLGSLSLEEKRVSLVFVMVSLAWISRSLPVVKQNLPFLDDTIIALIGVLLLFIIPSSKRSEALLDWKTAEKIPWGILILFGGGLSLAEGFKVTGLAEWIGSQFIYLDFIAFGLFLLIIVAAVNFLTEITSNVATASMLLPILAAVSASMGVHPFGLMFGATMAASCAFMLPVATPPNAVVFGSGYLEIKDMIRAGFWLNIFSIIVITLITRYALPFIWGLDLFQYPF
ncbi:SLC13 family permease [Mongoliitalea daihaiensis]|uniref:SLC13 family permease n=1 Tax=Mongoliitalea daihaiensis TaxID=2782006 RepID=UPI001F23B5A0|nr:DASS family sodium-coupled anion symporter [Mongoliitalea daihaiensis]UJP64138.1 DASS family sodium-coupled anion symporter [Mongoliitalea daihaiensis]